MVWRYNPTFRSLPRNKRRGGGVRELGEPDPVALVVTHMRLKIHTYTNTLDWIAVLHDIALFCLAMRRARREYDLGLAFGAKIVRIQIDEGRGLIVNFALVRLCERAPRRQ